MLNIERVIQPLTDFKRDSPSFLARLKATGRPVILAVNGKAEVVVQDARSYQRLLDLAERLETIEAVREGIASADRGEGRPMEEAFDRIEETLRAKIEA